MSADLSAMFTGIRFENPFLLASAPPTESDTNIMRAFEAGWGGVVTKTIGLHPVVNVAGPKTKFLRTDTTSPRISMKARPDSVLHSSWNWELISDKPLDWWVGRLSQDQEGVPEEGPRRLDHGGLGQRQGALTTGSSSRRPARTRAWTPSS